ncbi:aspartate-semialdehyde dehydrogenase 2 [Abditibacteriota bacterium]|nr:aspartate-semialdehyde dehydrogenase 2 [Abditibacteriota bacterium]
MIKKKVAVIGATGIAGQQFLAALPNHPEFELVALAASSRSAGKSYLDAIREPSGMVGWWCDEPLHTDYAQMQVQDASKFDATSVDCVFTAVESDAAKELEPMYALTTPVVSTASAFRYFDDTPIFVPGVNNSHVELLSRQQKERGWKGFVTPVPNCTTTGLAMTLKPIQDAFGIKGVVMTSMQAMSGAGRRGGVLGLDALDNIIPYISGEEEKVQKETQKILGSFRGDAIVPASFGVSATCTRANVSDGHTEAVFVATEKPCSVEDAARAMREFEGGLEGLTSTPEHLIFVHDDPFRPQPRRDRDMGGGMTTVVGRLRPETVLGQSGIKYVLVSHNTKMGAAKGAILVAELLVREGRI